MLGLQWTSHRFSSKLSRDESLTDAGADSRGFDKPKLTPRYDDVSSEEIIKMIGHQVANIWQDLERPRYVH